MRIVLTTALVLASFSGNLFSQSAEQSEYQVYVSDTLDACRNNRGGIFAFPELEKYYSLLLESKTVGVLIRSSSSDGNKVTRSETTIFFRKGELYVRATAGSKTANYVTTREGVYSWVDGSESGEIYRSSLVDQAQYFVYLLDPSAIMKSFFHNYLSDRKAKSATETSVELEAIVDGGVWNVLLAKPDLWFARLLVIPPEKYSNPGTRSEMTFELLGTDLTIPPNVLSVPEGMEWKKKSVTVASNMAWL